jgi:hypothetical protein
MWDVGRSVSPPRDPGRLVEQRRAECARGVPQQQRALEPEQQPGLPLCRAHDGAGWLPPEQTGVLSVVFPDGEWLSTAGVLVAGRGRASERSPVVLPRGPKCPQRVILHERGLTLSSAGFPQTGRRNGVRIDYTVLGVQLRSAKSFSAFAGSPPEFFGWGRRRMKKGSICGKVRGV